LVLTILISCSLSKKKKFPGLTLQREGVEKQSAENVAEKQDAEKNAEKNAEKLDAEKQDVVEKEEENLEGKDNLYII